MALPFLTAYGPKERVQARPTGESRTKQSFKAECDINTILARYKKTGTLDFVARFEPRYGDATGNDFQEAMNLIASANSMFQAMPAHLRDRFHNRPQEFLDFVNNDANKAEAEQLGLLRPKAPAPEPQEAAGATGAQPAPTAPAAPGAPTAASKAAPAA